MTRFHLLLIEDNPADADLIPALLEDDPGQWHLLVVERLHQGIQVLQQQRIDLILADLSLPDAKDLDAVLHLQRMAPQVPIVVLTGLMDEEIGLAALRQGAQDYLIKDQLDRSLLLRAMRYALERAQVQRELQKALQQERDLNALKSRFINTICHEYRTPLTSILSSAEILESYRSQLSEEKQIQHLHRIQTAAVHLSELLTDVVNLGQTESKYHQLHCVSLDLVKACQDLLQDLALSHAEGHRIRFQSSHLSLSVWLDPRSFRQILTNLLENALKYSPSSTPIQLQLQQHGNRCSLSVRDFGVGIHPQDLPHIFESFYRSERTQLISGTGLGLSIVKRLVELHGGELQVDSQLGKGSTFRVQFPLSSHPDLLGEEGHDC
jgi:signal transduction histidine kinase